MSDLDEVIAYLNAQMLASLALPPPSSGPEPLMCPACGTTRDACLRRFGRDPVHDAQVLAVLDERARTPGGL